MTGKENFVSHYRAIICDCNRQLSSLSRKGLAVALSRLAVFVATASTLIWVRDIVAASCLTAIAGITLFLFLTTRSSAISRSKDRITARQRWAESQIRRAKLDLDGLPGGAQYIDPTHHFSFDIDLFGDKSLFALLDSTSTQLGSRKLAEWLSRPDTVADDVEVRQNAIRELTEKPEFLLSLSAAGIIASDEIPEGNPEDKIPDFSINKLQRAAVAIVPFLYVAAFCLLSLDLISGTQIFLLFLWILALGSLQAKRIGKLHDWTNRTIARLSCFSEVFQKIENEPFTSDILRMIQNDLTGSKQKASLATRHLARLLHNLDQRYNAFGYAIMNGFLLWDWRQIGNIDRWMKQNGQEIDRWKKAIAEIDALSAIASFARNNPDYTFPKVDHSGTIIMKAKAAGHPLIPNTLCVRNDIETIADSSFFVVTGANMAGKSTYLRTVATNFLLANIGAPVCARSMLFSKAELFTSLRTSDSLASGKSYFFAELERLRDIVRQAESGRRTFVILDEILRGTNSADKQKGSIGLVRKLIDLPVGGIIATHDLALGKLAEKFPEKVCNFRFEADITDDKQLSFSYRILPGIAQNANASFLMEQMGIISYDIN